jgi:AraC-like DNA-binding protein
MLAFDLFVRKRVVRGDRDYRIDDKTDPQPAWRETFDFDLPRRLPVELVDSARFLVALLKENYWHDRYSHCEANARLHLWLVDLLRFYDRSDSSRAVAPGDDRIVEWAEAFMQNQLHRGITVKDIGAACGLSRNRFTEVYRAARGETPGARLDKLQLTEACRLLAGTNEPISRVAHRSGYRSATSLYRRFRTAFGMTPKAWRAEARRRK